MPTYTIYASAADGYVRSASTVYATARAGAGLTVDTTSTSNSWGIGQRLNAGTYQLTESFFSFDTSSVVGTVTSVTLSLYLETDSSTTDFTVEARLYDWGTGLTTADWVPGANLAALPLLGSVSTAGLVPPAYFAFAENGSTFQTNINQTGETRIVVVSSRLTTGTAPTGVEAIEVSYADTVGTTQDPKLVIVTSDTPVSTEPVVTLEMALDSPPGEEAPVWTDLSVYLLQATTRRGRSRELERYMAGEAEFVLVNDDRRFDPMYAAGPYFGKIRPMKRVRLQATYASVTYPIYDGYVDSWEQVYQHPQAALAVVKCTDAFKILAGTDLPASAYALEVDSDAPALWWRLDEPQTSSVAYDSTGNGRHGTLFGTVTFGAASQIVNDPDTAVQFSEAANSYIKGSLALSGTVPFAFEMWFTLTAVPSFMQTLFITTDSGVLSQNLVQATINSVDGKMSVTLYNTAGTGFSVLTPSAIVTNQRYHLVVTHAADRILRIYLDGALVATGSGATTGTFTSTDVHLGSPHAGASPHAIVDEFAVYTTTPPNSVRIGVHNDAGRIPWRNDLPGARAHRVLDYLDWPGALRDLDTGRSVLQSATLSSTLLEHLQKVAESEFGALFVSRDGKVTLVERDNLVNLDSQATFGDLSPEWEYTALDFDYSDADIRNDVTVSRYEGTAQRAQDATSIAAYLRHSFTIDGLLYDADSLSLAAAQYFVGLHKDPKLRVTQLRLEPVDGTNAALFAEVLERELTEWVTVRRRPQNLGAAIDQVCVLEGIDHELAAKRWVTTFRLSPAPGPAGGGCFIEFDDGAGSAPCGFNEFAFAL